MTTIAIRGAAIAALLAILTTPAAARTAAPKANKQATLNWAGRMKVRLAPVRVYDSPRALSKVSLGLQGKQRIVKAVTRQLPDGRLVLKQYGHKRVGAKLHRAVMSTVISPDGTARHTLNVRGMLKRSWTGQEDYKRLTPASARVSAVAASPATRVAAVTLAVSGAVVTLNPEASLPVILKAMALPAAYTGLVIAGTASDQIKPSVQSLNE
jgi:hypothetical protein